MDVSSSWIKTNWFDVVQTIGVIGGLFGVVGGLILNAVETRRAADAAHREARAREIDNIFKQSDHHRMLWGEILQNPNLKRVLEDSPDVLKKPLNEVEKVFINEAFAQYLTSWRIANIGGLITLDELAVDVKWFSSLPLPHVVWEETKRFKNIKFVEFVTRSLEAENRV